MDDHDLPLAIAEFYFYTIGDKSVYNQELNDLFVCYILARGLQVPCDCPRRPPLPLELILRIIRYAGFVDPKPDMVLTSDAFIFTKSITDGPYSAEFYITERLSRAQLASMARLQLVKSGRSVSVSLTNKLRVAFIFYVQQIFYNCHDLNPRKWAFIPLGTQDEKLGFPDGSKGIVATLFPCRDEAEIEAVESLNDGVIISETFPPDHEIGKQLDDGELPCIVVVSREQARLLVWRWWEPRF
jgi:hypothetical protein